jgi:hypothetical protein
LSTPHRRRFPFVLGIAWLTTASAAIELCAREVARRSIVERLTGFTPGGRTLAIVILTGLAALALDSRDHTAAARDRGRRTLLLFTTLFATGLALQLQLGARLQSDGFYYFAYLRSLAFDRDFDFTNDYTLLGLNDKPELFKPTPTGHAQSAASIGPAIFWAPFFAAAHVVAKRLESRHQEIDANGISFPYRQAVCVAGLLYGLAGCWFCFRLTRRVFDPRIAALATTLVITGSFMLWYLVKEPSMTHAPSMAVIAAFVWAWAATRDARTLRQWAWLGALAGLMTLIRWQNALFALLPACDAIAALVAALRTSDRSRWIQVLKGGALFTVCATLAFVPQMIAWRAIYGSWLAVSPLGPQIRWGNPQFADILWSSRNGLLSWSPILYVGAIGLFMFAAREPGIGVAALLMVVVMTYFNATIQDWWGSDGFGGRRFDGTIPLFCLGVAAFTSYAVALTRRHPLRVVAAGGALLVVWNLTLMSAADSGVFRIGTPVSFGDTAAAQARAFHAWFGHPFTYPASLVFALRNDLAPAKYDLLSTSRFLSDPLRPYGRVDIGGDDGWLIEDGWHGAEHEGAITFRWAASAATVLIPLDHIAPLTLQLRLHALTYPGWTTQSVTLRVNGHSFGPVPVHGSWETLEFATEPDAWRSGVNRLRLEFASVRTPAEVGLGGDARQLAAAVDYVRVQQR